MQRLSKFWTGVAALGLLSAASFTAQSQKKVKDQGEYDIFNEVIKDVASKNFTKAVTDLDAWQQKYPGSDYQDDREVLYLQAYAGAKQPAKAVDRAGPLLERDLDAVFSDPRSGPQQVVMVLFTTAVAVQQISSPTPQQLALGEKAAHMLVDYNRKPENVSDADWAKARDQLHAAAQGALLFVALKPGADAVQKRDYAAAEALFGKALQQYPDSGQVAYQLGAAEVGEQASDPAKAPLGIYEIARAVALDPAKGGLADPAARAQVDAYLKKVYTTWHGSEEGLDQLKQQGLRSPTPPPGFHIQSRTEIAREKLARFEKDNPQLALWIELKAQLADPNGQQYFETSLKDTDVPPLRGRLLEAVPECKPRELVVGVPLPGPEGAPEGAPPLRPEITLKLETALTGKPEVNSEFQWQGVPSAFTSNPFMLTMDVEKDKLEGLAETPCTAAPVRRTATKTK